MGTVVFTDAPVKIFLDASAEARAERRYNQLKNNGLGVNLRALLEQIQERDARDRERVVAPLKLERRDYTFSIPSITFLDLLEKGAQINTQTVVFQLVIAAFRTCFRRSVEKNFHRCIGEHHSAHITPVRNQPRGPGVGCGRA